MKRFRSGLALFIFASLFIHGSAYVSILKISELFKFEKPKKSFVEMEIVPQPIPVAEIPAETESEPLPETKVQAERNQIVDQDQTPLNDEVPTDTRFLGAHNQVVQKQTVAKNVGEFKNKSASERSAGDQGTSKSEKSLDLKPDFSISKSVEDQVEKEKLALSEQGLEVEKAKSKSKDKHQASNKRKEGLKRDQGKSEASQTLDYIKDLDPGLETLLSTKEFVYYSYFNRIRTQLNHHWTDLIREKLSEVYKKGRSIASTEDRVTRCLVTLDTTGRLLKVQIIGDSGVKELDEAATEAFRNAAPFPNPPRGMVDQDGTIKIRWDFILEA